MFRFAQPWAGGLLLALLAAALLAWRRRPPALRMPAGAPWRRLAARAGAGVPRWRWPLLLTTAGLALCVAALMRPQAGLGRSVRHSQGIDIMLALDVSGSMESFDVPPEIQTLREAGRAIEAGRLRDRLSVAKAELERFVRRRADDRIGVIAFARLPYLICPPTLDHEFLVNHLQSVHAGSLPDGTNLAGAVAAAAYRLKDAGSRRRVAVLFTDGVNNIQDRVTPRQAAELAAACNVTLYTVGIGSDRAVGVGPDWLGNRTVQAVEEASLDEALPREVATATGGRYFAAQDAAGFARAMAEIDRLEKVEIEVIRFEDWRERFPGWLAAGLILLLAAFGLEQTCCQSLP
ncbi:MAG: VWA domain-containing protein [Lentisphaeria bacterium]|jgi:Ca-activated chloride channel family protein